MTQPNAARERAETLIKQFYRYFNERRFDEAAALFTDDATLEHTPLRRKQQGGSGYREFAEMWVRAFPDAVITVGRVAPRDSDMYEVDLTAKGTHLGELDFGGAGRFRPSGVEATLTLRQLFELRDDYITYSGLSFDLQDVVAQLVIVDVPQLLEHLRRIETLRQRLQDMSAAELVERNALIHRLGLELDSARHVVRPYYRR